jgi:hypothetical protein
MRLIGPAVLLDYDRRQHKKESNDAGQDSAISEGHARPVALSIGGAPWERIFAREGGSGEPDQGIRDSIHHRPLDAVLRVREGHRPIGHRRAKQFDCHQVSCSPSRPLSSRDLQHQFSSGMASHSAFERQPGVRQRDYFCDNGTDCAGIYQ